MATVEFTSQLHRYVDTPRLDCASATLGEALAVAFDSNPRLRGYILDDQGHLRTHVAVFIDGHKARDRERLSDPLTSASKVYVLQALSGG
jgi:hypothetical protein